MVVIGAGPAGLAAAYEFARHGTSGVLLESHSDVGGLSRTVERDGYRFDIGGHRFFSKSPEIQSLWDQMAFEPLLVRPRLSRIYYDHKFYDYPLKAGNALKNMGLLSAVACVGSYARSRLFPIRNPSSLEEWVINEFGSRLYRMFFKPYTEKVWGISCDQIGADWAAQRIKGLSLGKAIASALFGRRQSRDVKTLIEEFRYPRLGPGQLWEDCARRVRDAGWSVRLASKVTGIERTEDRIVSVIVETRGGNTETVPCGQVLSSMPLKDMILGMRPQAPESVIDAAEGLAYRDFITVALVLDTAETFPDNWIYVHSPDVKLGRVQNFKNWSPDLVPDKSTTCLGLEYFCNVGDALWNMSDDDLVRLGYDEITRLGLTDGGLIKGYVVRVPKAYPVYDQDYQQRLRVIRQWLEGIVNLQCIGRNAQHRYNNMDHSMMTALIAARNIIAGVRRDPWSVNEDAEYIEAGAAAAVSDACARTE